MVDAPVRIVRLAVVVVVEVGAPATGEGVMDVQSELRGRVLVEGKSERQEPT
ncbi:hypothetical protein [Kribbella sp. VKM Ac-2568]|uniref:hypothetical protein n=1 Tax=Kribbella sp. VKM Ac-2568 TaxID=2512219 RepID=UPI00130542B5|nr:hypothetical protein [Kribbella sp. VKM Ac-2568]